MSKTGKIIRQSTVAICQAFVLYTIVMLLVTGQYSRLPLAFATILLVLIPGALEVFLHCRMHPVLYILGVLYALGPMLGQCHGLYYSTSWWDKLLHICGGVLFAVAGLYLCRIMNRDHSPVLLCAVFALCFSISISALWEFVEFGSDQLLHTDMQRDSLLNSLYSYTLGDSPGTIGSLEHIQIVSVDGAPLPVTGYLDVGLWDTMTDMLLESLGAVAVCAVYLLDRGKHPFIQGCNDCEIS